jgi:hypothetical protein
VISITLGQVISQDDERLTGWLLAHGAANCIELIGFGVRKAVGNCRSSTQTSVDQVQQARRRKRVRLGGLRHRAQFRARQRLVGLHPISHDRAEQ